MNEFDVPEDRCICCLRILNAARNCNAEAPNPGDITICMHCGMPMQFGKKLQLEHIPAKELTKLKRSKLWNELVDFQNVLDKFL